MRPAQVPSAATGFTLPETMLPTCACVLTSPEGPRMVSLSIQPQIPIVGVGPPPSSKRARPVFGHRASTVLPSGEIKRGGPPSISAVPNCTSLQFLRLIESPQSQGSKHGVPAGTDGPATMHVPPPMVKRRTAVIGSTTCSSVGPQQPSAEPVEQARVLPTTRLPPCQPIGHSPDVAVWSKTFTDVRATRS